MNKNIVDKNNEIIEKYSDSMLILVALSNGNPGACSVICKLFEVIEKDETKHNLVMNFIKNLINKNIIGSRLWYIYKNESNSDIYSLLNINLDNFTDEYFYEKFEKYT